jgi:hypothetical protein
MKKKDEQNKEGNRTECTNKKQQRRTKEHTTPIIQNSPSEEGREDTHEEGDEM